MTPPETAIAMELAPTVTFFLGTVQTNAAKRLAAAQTEASAHLESARTEAAAIVAHARADGAASAVRASAVTLIAAGRAGREVVLAEHHRVYEALQQGVRDELLRRADSPAGAAFFARLENLARTTLGPDARIARFADGRIGVSATAGKRHVDISADPFIERELTALGDRLTALWQ